MIQIYLLCLAREGKLRIGLSPKSGLATDQLDYSNLAEVEFSAKVIDSFLDVQRLKRPENWEVLRPYAEKLLQDDLPSTHDDSVIAGYRKKLKECFTSGRELAEKVTREAADLFASIKMENPYSTELKQADTLFHMVAMDCERSVGPYIPDMPMQPRAIGKMLGPSDPRQRVVVAFMAGVFSWYTLVSRLPNVL